MVPKDDVWVSEVQQESVASSRTGRDVAVGCVSSQRYRGAVIKMGSPLDAAG